MNREFNQAFDDLNAKQKEAAMAIDGPLLVLAGPGTGKTQLLSVRVGYILKNTDVLAQNILCLTFTEAGAEAMRQRLTSFLGQEAYDITISTYHSFGSDLLKRYPQYANAYGAEPIDELGSDSLIREILAGLPYDNPVKSADAHAADLRKLMSECKRGLLEPKDVRQIARNNLDFINKASVVVNQTLAGFVRIDKSSAVIFERLYEALRSVPAKSHPKTSNLKTLALESLQTALEEASPKNTKPLTAWKNQWLAKDGEGGFVLAGEQTNRKLLAAARVYSSYQKELGKRRLYDYDDMILKAIAALQSHPDFKFTLAEQYQYLLLDEFQDTNAAQFRLLELLTDNPVHEGRPNIMAVGDDDQAIYAFQGAELANMYRFTQLFRDVKLVPLRDNYRSHGDILDVAYNIGDQIQNRLSESFDSVSKILKQSGSSLPNDAEIAHYEFTSDAAQYVWVAEQVKKLVNTSRIPPQEIAILAPKHRYLIPILPYLAEAGLPVRYEKRENVLDKPIVHQLTTMSRLVLALAGRRQAEIDGLWPEVLSYDFWGLSTTTIWDISWQADTDNQGWTRHLLNQPKTKAIAEFFLQVKDLLPLTTLEQQLDLLTGVRPDDLKTYKLSMRSPLFEYYFGGDKAKDTAYLEHLGNLSVLRGRLRAWRRQDETPFSLADFNNFINQHRQADINILNTNPHYEAEEAVNIMTAYQAKGREFRAVFILATTDEVWGAASRTNTSNISLPPNLEHIRYQGASDDERLRLLYVAMTRAKSHLYLTSYTATMDGKHTRPLKYLAGQNGLEPITAKSKELELSANDMQNYWHLRHLPAFKPKLSDLLETRLNRYQLSPTHLNQFTDVINGGPEQFFLNTILRFPKGQSPSALFGNVVHETIKWIHDFSLSTSKTPSEEEAMTYFNNRLKLQRLAPAEHELQLERGYRVVVAQLAQGPSAFGTSDKHELNFASEGVFCGPAHLSGKIDKLIFDKKNKTITVVDFKTGRSFSTWGGSDPRLHKYRQQLSVYKLLVEGSHSYTGWKVEKGILEFVEPDTKGRTKQLETGFNTKELAELQTLIQAVWEHIKNLDFPDISSYKKSLSGIRTFENNLKRARK